MPLCTGGTPHLLCEDCQNSSTCLRVDRTKVKGRILRGRYEKNRGDRRYALPGPGCFFAVRLLRGRRGRGRCGPSPITTDAHNHGKHSPFRHNNHGTRSRDSTAVRNNHTRRRTHRPERGSRKPELSNHMQAVDSHRKLAVDTHTLGHYYTHTLGRRRQHQQPLHPRLQQRPLRLYLPL